MKLSTPYYLLEETLLRRNLSIIRDTAERAGVEFILAFKAFALWRTFPIFREYINHTTASSPYEARLAMEEFGSRAHTYSPAYEEGTFDDILRCSSHITFNSLAQLHRFTPRVKAYKAFPISMGLRVNPERSEIETELYNPCAPGSRFGVLAADLPSPLPPEVEGLHVHCHCESDSYQLERTIQAVEEKFGAWLPTLKWLNLGGGHLLTRQGYDVDHLVGVLQSLRERYPQLRLILEPGSAFAWQTGDLYTSVVDIVVNHGVRTAVLNVSFTCHMPDCLEMPYHPEVVGAKTLPRLTREEAATLPCCYRLGGNSCLSGDYMGYWQFEHPLEVGDVVVLRDMLHYTTVKTNMFNGIHHPSIALRRADGSVQLLRSFRYEDYRDRMD